MKKYMLSAILAMFLGLGLSQASLAVGVGDRVHVIFEEAQAYIESGYIVVAGENSSKVEWDNCNTCSQWISNSSFYYSLLTAETIVNERNEQSSLSLDELGKVVGGAVIGFGVLYCIFEGC
jgi:hypothetical protein